MRINSQIDFIYEKADCKLNIYIGDNLEIIDELPYTFRLIYMDSPFNTGKRQIRKSIKIANPNEIEKIGASNREEISKKSRTGFKNKMYYSKIVSNMDYTDKFDSLSEFLYPRIEKMYNKLTDDGSILVHLDYREVHNVKVFVMDKLFGSECFMNEIIWAYDYGAKATKRWPTKHDTILWYVKNPDKYVFNYEEVERIPYMAPGLVSKEKAEKGKIITDVWWHTIVCGKERNGYPTQKPRGIIDRFIKVHSLSGDYVMDPFAGSGSFGESALLHGRNCVLIDNNLEAMETMEKRFKRWDFDIKRKD